MNTVTLKTKVFSQRGVLWLLFALILTACYLLLAAPKAQAQVTNPQTGSVGLTGTIPTEPPQTGATVSFPTNGQVFTNIPITVQGICPPDLLVKIFKNEVFSGAVFCGSNGTFSLEIDLFSGRNELVARVYDALDQPGPDSNKPVVTYNDNAQRDPIDQLVITSNYALRGADAGTRLTWPLAVAGGVGPYAVSIDWGDGESSQIPLELAGDFTAEHTYVEPGVYRMIVKVTDSRGKSAFLQLVAVSNGDAGQDNSAEQASLIGAVGDSFRIPPLPIYIMFFFIISTFWLGRRYEVRRIKNMVRTGRAVQL